MALAGCAPRAPVAAARSELRIAIPGDIRGTNPGVMRDGNTDTVIHHIVESLVAYRSDLSVAPLLAERVEASEGGAVYTFHLRRDVEFHNREPMTSREVLWSWRCRHLYDGTGEGTMVVSIDAPDRYTVIFRLQRPDSLFLDRMANIQCVTAILHPDSVDADGEWIEPVATGPYVMQEWKHGEYMLLRRFDHYSPRTEPRDGYAGARHAETQFVRFVIVPEPAIGVAGIIAGDLDILPHVPPYLAQELARHEELQLHEQDLLYWSALLVNSADPLLGNPLMRRALAHALDTARIAEISTFGQARANSSAVPLLSPYHTGVHDRWWPYDPAEAKRLLGLAGYAGQKIRIQTNRKYPVMFDNAVAIQAMLTAVGIDAPLQVLDWGTQLADYFSGDFQLSSFGFSARTHPVLNYDILLGDKEIRASAQWQDEAASRRVRQAEATRDVREQTAIFEKIHLMMVQDVPILGLFNDSSLDATRADVEGYEPWPLANPRLWGVRKNGH